MKTIDHKRLGDERRHLRDYSLHQRIAGMTAADRIYEISCLEAGCTLLVAGIFYCQENIIEAVTNLDSTSGLILERRFLKK